MTEPDATPSDATYQYSRIEFWHPDPQLDVPGVVSIETIVAGEPLFARSIEVA